MVSGPSSDDFAARLALDYSARDTYIDYKNPRFQSSGTDQDLSALDARAKVSWLPSAIEGLQVKYTFNHNHSNRPSQESASEPSHKLDHTSTTMPSWQQDTNTSILDIDYELTDDLRLFNQSQYSLSSVERRIGGNGEGDADVRQKNASNETRLNFGEARDTFSGFTGIYAARTTSDESLKLGGNLFYMDMKDAQYNIPVVISSGVSQSYTINAQKAHAYGAELSANYRVLDNLTLNANAGWLRTRIDDIDSNDAYAGNEFARSPGYTLSIGPSWDITERLNLNVQVRHVDGYYSDVANNKSYSIDGYTLTDARASYRFSDQVELYSYVKNVFDDRSATYMQQNRGIGGIEANMTQPRTLGVGVKGSF